MNDFLEFFTGGFICSKDSLAGSDDLMSDVTELLLLLRSEEGVCVRHPDSSEGQEDRGCENTEMSGRQKGRQFCKCSEACVRKYNISQDAELHIKFCSSSLAQPLVVWVKES